MVTHCEAQDPVEEQLDEYVHRIKVSHDEAHARARRFRIRPWLDWIRSTGRRFDSPGDAADAYVRVLRDEYSREMTEVHLDTIYDFVDYLEGGDAV